MVSATSGAAAAAAAALGVRLPLVLAPMAAVSGGALAAAVSGAGGLGLLAGGYCREPWLWREWEAAGDASVGVGFVTWALDAAPPTLLARVLERRPAAVMLSFGPLGRHAAQIRAAGVPLLAQVSSLAEGRAAAAAGADVVVAQGSEAGGHAGRGLASLTLAPLLAQELAPLPVLLAGGVADGRGLAAALAAGAGGAMVGTRFLATPEALVEEGAQARILAAEGACTVEAPAVDAVRGLAWPHRWRLRVLENAFTRRYAGEEGARRLLAEEEAAAAAHTPGPRAHYAAAVEARDFDEAAVVAGDSSALVHCVKPAAEVVEEIVRDAAAILARPSPFTL